MTKTLKLAISAGFAGAILLAASPAAKAEDAIKN